MNKSEAKGNKLISSSFSYSGFIVILLFGSFDLDPLVINVGIYVGLQFHFYCILLFCWYLFYDKESNVNLLLLIMPIFSFSTRIKKLCSSCKVPLFFWWLTSLCGFFVHVVVCICLTTIYHQRRLHVRSGKDCM